MTRPPFRSGHGTPEKRLGSPGDTAAVGSGAAAAAGGAAGAGGTAGLGAPGAGPQRGPGTAAEGEGLSPKRPLGCLPWVCMSSQQAEVVERGGGALS